MVPSSSTLPPDFHNVILNIHEKVVQTAKEDVPSSGHFAETSSKISAALARIDEVHYGQERFPALEEKAAILIKELNDLHCFPDGNKRTSLVAMAYYLFWNFRPFVNTTTEAEMVRRIADPLGKNPASFPEIVEWIQENSRPVELLPIAQSRRFDRYPKIDLHVSVEKTEFESRDRIAIRADAHDPVTKRQLSKFPVARWFADFRKKAKAKSIPPKSQNPPLEDRPTPIPTEMRKQRTKRKQHRRSANKRKRRKKRN